MGPGTYSREDEELHLGESEGGRPMRIPGVDCGRPPAARELRRCAGGQGSARGGERSMTNKSDEGNQFCPIEAGLDIGEQRNVRVGV